MKKRGHYCKCHIITKGENAVCSICDKFMGLVLPVYKVKFTNLKAKEK